MSISEVFLIVSTSLLLELLEVPSLYDSISPARESELQQDDMEDTALGTEDNGEEFEKNLGSAFLTCMEVVDMNRDSAVVVILQSGESNTGKSVSEVLTGE